MKKICLFSLILTIFLVSCENVDLSKVSEEDVNKVIVCPDKYIRFGTSCCLDKNNNNICDEDEEIEEEPPIEGCKDECSSDACSGLDYVECLIKSDGCKDRNFRGKVAGKCGVECTTDNDCSSNQECLNYKCKTNTEGLCENECTEDSCKGKEFMECKKGADGCMDEVSLGIKLTKCGVECLTDSDCDSGEVCDVYECIQGCDSHHEMRCYNNDVYWYDSCGEIEDKHMECDESPCECGGDTLTDCGCRCLHQHTKDCYDGDVFWYDSCGGQEEKAEECGELECSQGQCIITV